MAQYTIEQLGQRVKQRASGKLDKFSDIEIGERVYKRAPDKFNGVVAPVSMEAGTKLPAPPKTDMEKGFGERVKERLVERGQAVSDTFAREGKNMQKSGIGGDILAGGRALIQTLGQGATFAGEVVNEGLKSGFRALPDSIEQPIREVARSAIETRPGQAGIRAIQSVSEKAQELEKKAPTIGGIARIGLGAAELAGAGRVVGGVTRTPNLLRSGASNLKNRALQSVRPSNLVDDAARAQTPSLGGFIRRTIDEKIQPALARRAINRQAQAIERQTIESVTPEVRQAIDLGVDMNDANRLVSIKAKPKLSTKAKEMLEESKKLMAGGKADPTLVVGRSALNKFKIVDAARKKAGEKLGEYADKIPAEKLKNTNLVLMERLKKVPGLKGVELKLSPKGWRLDFRKTTISRNKAAQKELIDIFNDAVKRDAKGKHLLRQELHEALGLKSATQVKKITTTADEGVEAIRQGLSDVLDAANDQYKKLNLKFATLEGSLKSSRRVLGKSLKASDDIRAKKLAQIVRRTTSNASADAETVLEDLQKALKLINIDDGLDLIELQEIYNIVERYFDVAKKTGLKNQVKEGVEGALPPLTIRDIGGKMLQAGIKKTIGPVGASSATRQKAIENLINSLLGETMQTKSPLLRLNTPSNLLEKKAYSLIAEKKDGLLNSYQSKHGNVINNDEFKEFFKPVGYDGSNAAAVHEPASELTKQYYARLLEQAKPGDSGNFLAGGAGSGKSSATGIVNFDKNLFVYDGTLANYESTLKKIAQAEAKGVQPRFTYVYRDLEDAWINGVVARAERSGRTVPLSVFLKDTKGARETIEKLASNAKYKDFVTIVDNSKGLGKAHMTTLDNLPKMSYNTNVTGNTYAELRQKTEELLRAGKISQRTFKGLIQ